MEEFLVNRFNRALTERGQAVKERQRFEAPALQDARNGRTELAQAMLREAERSARRAEDFSRMAGQRFQDLLAVGVA